MIQSFRLFDWYSFDSSIWPRFWKYQCLIKFIIHVYQNWTSTMLNYRRHSYWITLAATNWLRMLLLGELLSTLKQIVGQTALLSIFVKCVRAFRFRVVGFRSTFVCQCVAVQGIWSTFYNDHDFWTCLFILLITYWAFNLQCTIHNIMITSYYNPESFVRAQNNNALVFKTVASFWHRLRPKLILMSLKICLGIRHLATAT